MEFNNIDLLLEKYWAGESSLEEEKSLRLYFNQEEVEERHLSFVPLFQFFAEEEHIQVSDGFEEKLFEQLAGSEEKTPKLVPLPQKEKSKLFWALRIAATIALFLSLWFFYPKPAVPQITEVDQQEVEEAKIAYKQAKAALLLLSKKMNKGTQTALKGMNELEKATKVVRKKPQ